MTTKSNMALAELTEKGADADLLREMIEVLMSMCARLYGRRGARSRAMRATTAAKNTDVDAAG